jgi:hypothetical protein
LFPLNSFTLSFLSLLSLFLSVFNVFLCSRSHMYFLFSMSRFPLCVDFPHFILTEVASQNKYMKQTSICLIFPVLSLELHSVARLPCYLGHLHDLKESPVPPVTNIVCFCGTR